MRFLSKLILISTCCWAAGAHAQVSCQVEGRGGLGAVSPDTTCGPPGHPNGPPAPPAMGTTPAEIAASFPAIILYNFSWASYYGNSINTTVMGMTDKEIYVLASFYIANGGDEATLQEIAALNLDATNLVRWQAMFTQAIVNPYVGDYSPTPISTKYFAHPGLHAAVRAVPPSPPVPADPFASFNTPIDMMYLEYRTNPVTGCSAICAMTKVLAVLQTELAVAWSVGTAIGTTFYNAMTYLDPSYGYDLVISYGPNMTEYGFPIPPAGAGVVENPDGTWYDANGNPIPNPDPTQYGIPGQPTSTPPYTIFDPSGSCLLLLSCPT